MNLTIFIGGGLMASVWAAIGTLIVWHYPKNWIGWIMCLFPIGFALDNFSWAYYQFSLNSSAGSQTVISGALVWQNLTDFPPYAVLFGLFFLLFPTGKLMSPRWKWLAWFGVLAFLGLDILEAVKPGQIYPIGYTYQVDNPIGVSVELWEYLKVIHAILLIATIVFLICTVISQVIRLKRSRGEERQQVKWFAYFAVIFPIAFVVVIIFDTIGYTGFGYNAIGTLVLISFIGMAFAIAIAIFRYHLYAIDIIIRRTLQYTLLTGLLALIYLSSVVLLQRLIGQFTEVQSPAVTVISTLAIVMLFNPLRTRIQDFIDRRFYRQKYDAERALEKFSATARDEVDFDRLTSELLAVLEETVKPDSSVLWILSDPER